MTGTSVFALQPPPICEKPVKRVSQQAFLFALFIAALFVGAIAQIAGPPWLRNIFRLNASPAQVACALGLALGASVLIHELGHLIPSLCFGFYVSRVALGPVCATRTNGRWQLCYSPAWFSASIAATPADDHDWAARMLTVIAGGPIATLWIFLGAALLIDTVSLAEPVA
ncbi:MAG: hypothetical protein JO022_18730, partial [Acidobacteriaceae bacterium]|nr:hypothetical protein [Acidobacteriaceae bacterium]